MMPQPKWDGTTGGISMGTRSHVSKAPKGPRFISYKVCLDQFDGCFLPALVTYLTFCDLRDTTVNYGTTFYD